jgi:hypothetical protein
MHDFLKELNKNKKEPYLTGTVSNLDPLQVKIIPTDDAINVVATSNLHGLIIGSRLLLLKFQDQFIALCVIQNNSYPIGHIIYQRKTSDTSRTSTTSSDDPHLSITIPRNGIYDIEAEFVVDCDDNGTDIKISWTNSNVTELTRRQITGIGTNSTTTTNAETFYSSNYGFVTDAETGVTAAGWTIRREHFICSTDDDDGILTPSWGCINSSGTITLKAFSFIVARKIENN